jgi:hypothetical protein
MNRLTRLGTKCEFQSAMVKLGHFTWAKRRERLNREARARQSPRLVAENSRLNHKTGSPRDSVITLSMTHDGYHDSDLEIMSLVPSATTMAVV